MHIFTDKGLKQSMFSDIQDIFKHKYVIYLLINREVVGRFKGSFLGFAWTLVKPATMLFVYIFIIGGFLGASRNISGYAILLISGLMIWNFCSEAISTATASLNSNSGIVKKIFLPRQIFPIVSIGVAAFTLVTQLLFLTIAYLFYQVTPILSNLIYIVPVILGVFPLCLAFGLLLSGVNIIFRDTQFILDVVLTLTFWLTPAIYPWIYARDFFKQYEMGYIMFEIYIANPFTMFVMASQQAFWPYFQDNSDLIFFDSPFSFRLWFSVALSWILLWASLIFFKRIQGKVSDAI